MSDRFERLRRIAPVAIPALGVPAVLLAVWGTRLVHPEMRSLFAVFIASVAAVVWGVAQVREGRAGRVDPLHTRILAGLAIAAFGLNTLPALPGALAGTHVRSWNQFHYYLGAKYLKEVGWHDLYEAVLHADDRFQERKASAPPEEREALEEIPDFSHAEQLRSMTTYRQVPREEALADYDPSGWTPERLEELGRDSRWLRARARDDDWARRMVLDFGFNPAPPWTILGTTMANAIPLGSRAYPLITTSDFAVHVLAILALWWAFGLRAAALGAIWIHTIPLNGRLVVGGFLNYDWLGATILGIAAYRKERPVLSALALAYAGMTRVFPGVLVLPVVARWAWALVRGRPAVPLRRTFSLVFIAACAALFVGSHFTGRGLDTWPEWEEKISRHSEIHPTSGARRVGLGRLVRHDPKPGRFWRAQRPQGPAREAPYEAKERAGLVLGLLLLGVAIRRRTDHEAMVLMLFAVWLLAVSSRYYASVWVLLFTLPTLTPDGRRSWPGTLAAGALLVMAAIFYVPGKITGQYLLFNYEALALFVAICGAWIVLDRRRGLPEPGAEPDPELSPR